MVDRRTDLCDRADAVHNGSLALADALRGATLQVAVLTGNASATAQQGDSAWARHEPDGTWCGYHFDLLEDFRASAGCARAATVRRTCAVRASRPVIIGNAWVPARSRLERWIIQGRCPGARLSRRFEYVVHEYDHLDDGRFDEYAPFATALFGTLYRGGVPLVALPHSHDLSIGTWGMLSPPAAWGLRQPVAVAQARACCRRRALRHSLRGEGGEGGLSLVALPSAVARRSWMGSFAARRSFRSRRRRPRARRAVRATAPSRNRTQRNAPRSVRPNDDDDGACVRSPRRSRGFPRDADELGARAAAAQRRRRVRPLELPLAVHACALGRRRRLPRADRAALSR